MNEILSLDSSNKKRALIIGNNNYKHGRTLRYCINNARDLNEKLSAIHFQVTLGIDLVCEQVDTIIEEFVNSICSGDLIVFFFSGYGIHWNNENFLVPVDDSQITSCQMFQDRTVNIQAMMEMIINRRPSAAIFLFDCSRSYFIGNGTTSANSIDYGGLSIMKPLKGSLICFVCDADKTILDKSTNGRNTIFISQLIQHIDQFNLPIDEMMDLISDAIMADTDHLQCPFRVNSLRKIVYFNSQVQSELSQRRNSRLEKSITQSPNSSLLDLTNQQLNDRDIKFIAQKVIINQQCTGLWLGGNKITSVGASIIASALYNNTTLERLYLAGNRVSDIGCKYLSNTLSTNNTLKILALQDNQITDRGAEYISQMLRANKGLTGLWLDNNDFTNRGVILIANALQNNNSTLEYLDLSKNKSITDSSVNALEDMIKQNRTLNELSIYDCNLSRTAKETLKKAARSKTNFSVYLNSWNE